MSGAVHILSFFCGETYNRGDTAYLLGGDKETEVGGLDVVKNFNENITFFISVPG